MCTAIGFKTDHFYFGRTLDYDIDFGENMAFVPRNYELNFLCENNIREHYALMGIAHISDGKPLFYDAVNEKGLAMAGLNFVGNAFYAEEIDGKHNL